VPLRSIVKEERVLQGRIARAANRPRALFERRGRTPLAATFEQAPVRVGGRVPISASGLAVPSATTPSPVVLAEARALAPSRVWSHGRRGPT